jgi:hypothetical protein
MGYTVAKQRFYRALNMTLMRGVAECLAVNIELCYESQPAMPRLAAMREVVADELDASSNDDDASSTVDGPADQQATVEAEHRSSQYADDAASDAGLPPEAADHTSASEDDTFVQHPAGQQQQQQQQQQQRQRQRSQRSSRSRYVNTPRSTSVGFSEFAANHNSELASALELIARDSRLPVPVAQQQQQPRTIVRSSAAARNQSPCGPDPPNHSHLQHARSVTLNELADDNEHQEANEARARQEVIGSEAEAGSACCKTMCSAVTPVDNNVVAPAVLVAAAQQQQQEQQQQLSSEDETIGVLVDAANLASARNTVTAAVAPAAAAAKKQRQQRRQHPR